MAKKKQKHTGTKGVTIAKKIRRTDKKGRTYELLKLKGVKGSTNFRMLEKKYGGEFKSGSSGSKKSRVYYIRRYIKK